MPSPPTDSATSGLKSDRRITVQSMCCDTSEATTVHRTLTQAARHRNEVFKTTINRPPAQRSWSMVVPPVANLLTSSGSGVALDINHVVDDQPRPTEQAGSGKQLQRVPRRPRPSYTEEQKFFIMYHRIIRKLSWPQIEAKFAASFNIRTKDGLTSVYYRLRKDWGMKEVLKADCHAANDVGKVVEKAALFQDDFLKRLGYFDRTAVEESMQASIVR